VAVAVGGAGDVRAVGEECAEEVGFGVEAGVDGCCDEDFRGGGRFVGEEGGEFEGEGVRC